MERPEPNVVDEVFAYMRDKDPEELDKDRDEAWRREPTD